MPTLILRGCKKDGSSRNGYKYPLEVGATGTCPDWQPTAECGRGLHGFLHGVGDFSSCEFSPVDDLGILAGFAGRWVDCSKSF